MYELRADLVHEIRHQYACAASTSMVQGAVAGATTPATVHWGAHFAAPVSASYAIPTPPAHTHDLVAVRTAPSQFAQLADRVVIHRSVPSGTTTNLDVSDASGIQPQRITVTGTTYSDRSTTVARSELITSGGTHAPLSETLLFDNLPLQIDTVHASALDANDLNFVTLAFGGGDIGNAGSLRTQEQTARNLTSVTQAFLAGNDATPPAVSWYSVTPYGQLQIQWTPRPNGGAYRLVASTTNTSELNEWVVNTAETDSTGAITWTLPDLSMLPGWSDALGFHPLASVSWQVTSRAGTTIDQLISQHPTVEARIDSAGFGGRSMVPAF